LVGQGTFACDHLEVFMETGEVIETAFKTKLFEAAIIFDQQFAGMSNP
jgi:hypothetical protein